MEQPCKLLKWTVLASSWRQRAYISDMLATNNFGTHKMFRVIELSYVVAIIVILFSKGFVSIYLYILARQIWKLSDIVVDRPQ